MAKKRVLFVYNPHSGKGIIRENLSTIIDVFSGYDCALMVHATQARMDGAGIVGEYIAEGLCDAVICAGGDGTIDEVAGAVMLSGKDVPVGIISAGSTNDFGYSLGIQSDPIEAARTAISGHPYKCDIATLNGRYYTYTASFGLFTDVSYETPQSVKNLLGHAAYVLNGMTKLSQIHKYHARIKTDEGEYEDDYILGMVVNSLSVGGFRGITGDGVELDDGKYELILIRSPKRFGQIGKVVTEVINHEFNGEYLKRYRVSEASFSFDEDVSWSLDGEYGGSGMEAEIKVYNKAISYMR